ncbi:MAG: Crp/Fnr family transcriptional regulator [Saprospiraceae bacterium]
MDIKTKLQTLRQFPFFSQLSNEASETLASCATPIKKPRHHYVYVPGEPSDEVYFLIEGGVKIGIFGHDQRDIIRNILHPLAYFGELSLTGEERREDYAITMNEPVTLLMIKTGDILKAMEANYHLNILIMQALGQRLRQAEHRVESLMLQDARTRVIEFLKNTIRERGRRIGYEFLLKHSLTQQDIASITGTSRQTVTQVLNELKRSNLIFFTRRSILVRDLSKLDEITA